MSFYRFPQVKRITGLSRSTIFRSEREGKFPKRRQLGKKSVGWLSDEIDAWLAARPIVEVNKHD